MSEQRVYSVKDLDLKHLAQSLTDWFQAQEYRCQTLTTPGGLTVQARARGLKAGVALNVVMMQQDDNLQVKVGTGKWVWHAASGVVALIVFWPLLGLSAYQVYQQNKIMEDAILFVDQYVGTGGQVVMPGLLPPQAPAAKAAVQPTEQTRCPSCQEPVRAGAKFCDSCGAKLEVECVSCGATLRPGAKFCGACGEAVKAE